LLYLQDYLGIHGQQNIKLVASRHNKTAQLKDGVPDGGSSQSGPDRHRRNPLLDFNSHNDIISTNDYCQVLQKMCMKIKNKHQAKLTGGTVLLHDNTCSHVVHTVRLTTECHATGSAQHLAYTPNTSPFKLHILGSLKGAISSST